MSKRRKTQEYDPRDTTAMRDAVGSGDAERVAALIRAGADVDEVEEHGDDPPLIYAIEGGRLDLVRMLVEAGADANIEAFHWSSPLMCAARKGHRAIFDDLAPLTEAAERRAAEEQLDRVLRLGTEAGKLSKKLIRAAKGRNLDAARRVLEAGADVDGTDEDGWTALHHALFGGGDEGLPLVRLLLDAGADPNRGDGEDQSPLFFAYHPEIVRTLVRAGADVDSRNKFGATPLHGAAYLGAVPIVEALLACGAALESRDDKGESPLHRAAEKCQSETILLLAHAGADIAARDAEGRTPIDHARSGYWHPSNRAAFVEIKARLAESGRIDGRIDLLVRAALDGQGQDVRDLLAAGVPVDAEGDLVDRRRVTPLYVASAGGHAEVVRLLLESGADPNIRILWDRSPPELGQNDYATPLVGATRHGRAEIIPILTQAGAEPDPRSEPGQPTPLMWVAEKGDVEVVRALIAAGADLDARAEVFRLDRMTTALGYARSAGHEEIARILRDAGAGEIDAEPQRVVFQVLFNGRPVKPKGKKGK